MISDRIVFVVRDFADRFSPSFGRYCRIAPLLLPLLLLFPADVVAAEPKRRDSETKLAAIKRAWLARQEWSQAFHFVWDDEKTIPRNGLAYLSDAVERVPPDAVIPPHDTTFTNHCDLVIDGERGAYHEVGSQWAVTLNRKMPYECIDTVNKMETANLLHRDDFPLVTFKKSDGVGELISLETAFPIGLTFRILHPDFKAFSRQQMELLSSDVLVDGVRTDIVSFRRENGSRVDIWLDANHDWLPVRCLFVGQDEVTSGEVTIDVAKDESGRFVPRAWTHINRGADGSLRLVHKARVVSFTFNESSSSELFQMDARPGAWVNDHREGASNITYIVRGDGSRRYLKEGEGTIDYTRIMAEESPTWVNLLRAAIWVSVAVILLWLIFRRVRKRAAPA